MSRERIGYTAPHQEGAWSSAKNYTPLSVVTNSGSSYMAKKAVPAGTALNNSVYWGLLASVGSDPNISITKTGTSGLVDTYTWTDSTSGNTGTFTVTNGQDGDVTADVIATPYDNTAAYKVGNLLTYLGKQYYCIADAPAGTLPTNTTYFEEKSVADIIEMIKQGAIVTGHSAVADNLTPYSEDSGTTQENPFISQGTGTNNNSVIVTTGKIARQLEKQGNTVAVNQLAVNGQFVNNTTGWTLNSSTTYTVSNGVATIVCTDGTYNGIYQNFTGIVGHKYLLIGQLKVDEAPNEKVALSLRTESSLVESKLTTTNWTTCAVIGQYSDSQVGAFIKINLIDWNNKNVYAKNIRLIDLTKYFNGNDNIPADLLANPSHFSWYYNGSLAYDAGSLQNCNGRYLECGQGRQLWDETWGNFVWNENADGVRQNNPSSIGSEGYILVVPNKPIYFSCTTGYTFYVLFYDKDKNFIGYDRNYANNIFDIPSNCHFITFYSYNSYGTTYNHDITISLYYSPEEGGEGYRATYYPYIAPIRIDTGNETLKAFDKKLPSGVIERNTNNIDLGTLTYFEPDENGRTRSNESVAEYLSEYDVDSIPRIISSKYDAITTREWYNSTKEGVSITANGMGSLNKVAITSPAFIGKTSAEIKTLLTGVIVEVASDTPTTEQGTPYSEYADINDYSYMAWFDTDGNLVSIPQGCKLFYPVDYKGFTDDLVMYTNGDATALAKNEYITDAALNARGYYKMQDLSSSCISSNDSNLTFSITKAVKMNGLINLTLRANNGTGASISAGTVLFTLSNETHRSEQIKIVGVVDAASQVFNISSSGQVTCNGAIASGDTLHLYVSFIVA